MSKLKLPPHLRIAIWRAHEKRCIYREPVSSRASTIEHIVPESLLDQPAEYQRVRAEYGLLTDFNVNGLTNLVPTHSRPCNLGKGNRIFNPARARYFLEIASAKEPDVSRYAAAGLQAQSKENLLASLAISIDRGMLTLKDIEKSLADRTVFTSVQISQLVDVPRSQKLLSAQIELLLDKPVQIGGPQSGIDGVEFSNNAGCSFTIRTCREYRAAPGRILRLNNLCYENGMFLG